MPIQNSLKQFAKPGFLVALTLLLVNDFILKYNYPGFITGKLSDFAGLFIFPFFFAAFFPHQAKHIYWLTVVFFIFWKLPFSQPLIYRLNYLTSLGFDRTVDLSDLFALIIIPFSYAYLRKQSQTKMSFSFTVVVAVISIFSFCATSLQRQQFKTNMKLDKVYYVPYSKEKLFSKMTAMNYYSDSLNRNLSDSIFYLHYTIPKFSAHVTAIVKILYNGTDTTIIIADSIKEYSISGGLFSPPTQKYIDSCQNLGVDGFAKYFETNCINVLRGVTRKNGPVYFDNKAVLDKMLSPTN